MILLEHIRKSYPDGLSRNVVLKDVNLNVVKGDFVAITGASGSGKTTLLSLLGTLTEPDSGLYVLDGVAITKDTAKDLAELRNRKIGFVFQEHRLLPQLTVLQNILLPTLAFQKQTLKEQSEYAAYLTSLTGIASLSDHYPATLSGGEASRTALCRALIMKPLLLLADEPTGQLDSENARNIVALLKQVNATLGATVILVSHSPETVAAADRVLTLKDGVLL
jgi:ABC-type lipoprotein export system ATPase subunit